jgi:hypothetical protein
VEENQLVGKQAYFKGSGGEEKLIADMTTPELLEAVKFCKGYITSCSKRKRKAGRDLRLADSNRDKIGLLLDHIKTEIKERREVNDSSELKPGDKIIIRGKDDVFEVSSLDDLSDIDKYLKQKRILKYD